MTLALDILYRGPLKSCNYGCAYCPFAKKEETSDQLAGDRSALLRFVELLRTRTSDRIGVLFTPWGEALVRKWYRDALVELTHLAQIRRAAVQTNLSMPLDFVAECDPSKLGFWATYHPEWTEREKFVKKVRSLHERGIGVSAGIVGFRKFWEEAERLRAELPPEVYVWINAPKRFEGFDPPAVARLSAVDPLFGFNTQHHRSLGERCFTGLDTIAVDGEGAVRRCHFIDDVLGNLYETPLESMLADRPCPAATCGCHIGYVHLERLGLRRIFGDGILERTLAASHQALDLEAIDGAAVLHEVRKQVAEGVALEDAMAPEAAIEHHVDPEREGLVALGHGARRVERPGQL
jgi:MoaA/NifB/PqqE/SkfB family radical SAM enzyme